MEDGWLTGFVSDNGNGVNKMDEQNLFTSFFRGANEETQAQSGTRLGLFVVRTIIQLHGGQINVSSEFGIGTTIRFTLQACAPGYLLMLARGI